MVCTLYQPIPALSCTAPLFEYYWTFFEGVAADTSQLLEDVHRLRYQIFCIERNIFDPGRFPDGLEYDEYDNHSLQAVLRHRQSQTIAGAVRLVLHRPGASSGSLPFHRVCRDPRIADPAFLPFEATAEIGRFAISKAFRRRYGDGSYGQANDILASRRLIPHMTLGLMATALRLSIPYHIRYVCAVMEPVLLRLLARFGIRFRPIGPAVDYYGVRQPCYADLAELFAGIAVERPEIWQLITDCGRLLGPDFPAIDDRGSQPYPSAIAMSDRPADRAAASNP